MLRALKEQAISSEKAVNMSPGELEDKIATGVFVDVEKPEYAHRSEKLQLPLKR